MMNKTKINEYLTSEKIKQTYKNTKNILIGNLFASLPVTMVLWETLGFYTLGWDFLLVSILTLRYMLYRKIDLEHAQYSQIVAYDRLSTVLILLTGVTWGVSGVFFFDVENIKNISFLILTFTTILAGSLVSLSARPFSYFLFSISLISPIMLLMFSTGESIYFWMGVGLMIYLLFTFGFIKTINLEIEKSIKLNFENSALIKDLKNETERANKASEEKSRFLAAASHDLRQPLQSVNLFAEILDNKTNNKESKEYTSKIKNGLNSLNELIDALFDISKLDSEFTSFDKFSVSLNEILNKVEEQFKIQAKNKELDFTISGKNYNIISNPLLIERVITNILTNAIKYTEHGSICINIDRIDDEIHLHIKDTGIGIKEENIESIFEEFYQVNNKERESKNGLGLGLAIVRKILNHLDHRIEVTSKIGVGSTFTITFPKSSEAAICLSRTEVNNEPHNKIDGLNIFIVDNEESIVTAMSELISTWGGHSHGFTSTESALEIINSGEITPDFLIVDYRMPGKYNGCEFIDAARAKYMDLPALIVTGDTSGEMSDQFNQVGLSYLHKPVKPTQLRIIIRRILERQKREG